MLKAKVTQSDKGQMILLPEEFQLKQDELFINESGGVVFLWPTYDRWLPFEQTAGTFPENFLEERNDFIYKKIGDGYILYPANAPWFPLRLSIGQMPDDFMEDRDQPSWDEISEREPF